jgi:hypothetical protein
MTFRDQTPPSPSGSNRSHRLEPLATALVFLLALVIPGAGLALGVDRVNVSESEMRELAQFPKWSWQGPALRAWPGKFQRYFEDHFALRNRLMAWRSRFLWSALGVSSSPTVIAGRHGWLFYADDGGIEDYLQTEVPTTARLEAWRLLIERTHDWLASRGIRYLFVVAPDKQMIYPELMPRTLHRMRSEFQVDHLVAYMRRHSDVDILDLRQAVSEARGDELLYHRYDTHWNDRGGLVGYRAILKRLQGWFPALHPLARSDFDQSPLVPSGDRTTMLGLMDPGKASMPGLVLRRGWAYRVVEPATPDPYGEEGRRVTEIDDPKLPRAVMFRDSFAGQLIPYLSEHFGRAVYLWQNELDPNIVLRERPDVVIQEFVARHLVTYVPYPDGIPH